MKMRTKINTKIKLTIFIIEVLAFIITMVLVYFVLVPPLEEKTLNSAVNINTQIVKQTDYILSYMKDNNIRIYSSDDLKTLLKNYISEPSEKNMERIRLKLNELSNMNTSSIRYITIDFGGNRFDSITEKYEADIKLLDSDWYKNLSEEENSGVVSGIYNNGEGKYSAAYTRNYYLFNRKMTITVFFRVDQIINTVQLLSAGYFDSYMWLDNENNITYISGSDEWSQKIMKLIGNTTVYSLKTYREFNGYNIMNISQESRWVFVSYLSEKTIFNTFIGYLLSILFLFIFIFILSTLLLTPVLLKITNPLNRLAATMKEVARGDLNVSFEINTNDEIGELSRIFNNMVSELKIHINKLLEKEKKEQQMKYSLLVSQIDQHFIYNTMNTINVLARAKQYKDIISVNTALIKILQDQLRITENEFTDTIQNEVDVVKQYLIIQQYRYKNTVNIIWAVDDEVKEQMIPKNIIQPLVENALYHGLIDEETGSISGVIEISIQIKEKNLVIRVSDNGRGISEEKLQQLNNTGKKERGKHVGIANIRERIAYLYDIQNFMYIESKYTEGTCVTLTIPANYDF